MFLDDVTASACARWCAAILRHPCSQDNTNSPGWKFNHWEMKGVPLRMELGPLDIQKGDQWGRVCCYK